MAEHVEGNLLAAHQEVLKLGLLHPPGELMPGTGARRGLNVARYDVDELRQALLEGDAARCQPAARRPRGEGVAAPLVLWASCRDARARHLPAPRWTPAAVPTRPARPPASSDPANSRPTSAPCRACRPPPAAHRPHARRPHRPHDQGSGPRRRMGRIPAARACGLRAELAAGGSGDGKPHRPDPSRQKPVAPPESALTLRSSAAKHSRTRDGHQGLHAGRSAVRPALPRASLRRPRPTPRTMPCCAWRRCCANAQAATARRQRARRRRRARERPRCGHDRPPDPDRQGCRSHGARSGTGRRPARPGRRNDRPQTPPLRHQVGRMRVPLGVIGIIYEARPNVTADAAAPVPEERQRRHPARRFGGRCAATGARRLRARRAGRRRPAGNGGAGGRHHRPRRRGRTDHHAASSSTSSCRAAARG
jgi:hypothetical protein